MTMLHTHTTIGMLSIFRGVYAFLLGFPGGACGKEHACQCRKHKRCRFNPWVRKIPWRKAYQPTPVFLPGESHAQRSLAGYSPQGHSSWTRLKQMHFHYICTDKSKRCITLTCTNATWSFFHILCLSSHCLIYDTDKQRLYL